MAACSEYPVMWGSGASAYSLSCAPGIDFEAPSMSICRQVDGSACAVTLQPWPSFPECDFAASGDLVASWGVISMTVLVVIWAGKRVIELFTVHHTTD